MTEAALDVRPRSRGGTRGVDLSTPLFLAVSAVLALLVLFPLFWLTLTSFTDKKGAFTFANYVALATDPTLARAFGVALAMAASVGSVASAT